METAPDHTLEGRALQRELWEAARALLGDPGSADVDLRIVRTQLDAGGGSVLIRVRRGEVDRGRAALACVSAVGDQPVGLRVDGVSGTARAAEEKYMNGGTRLQSEERVVLDGAAYRAISRGDSRLDLQDGGRTVGATELDIG